MLAGDKALVIEGEVGGSGSNKDCEEVARKKRKRTRRESCFKEFTNFRCHREPKPDEGPGTTGLANEEAKVAPAQSVPVGWWGGESEETGFRCVQGMRVKRQRKQWVTEVWKSGNNLRSVEAP